MTSPGAPGRTARSSRTDRRHGPSRRFRPEGSAYSISASLRSPVCPPKTRYPVRAPSHAGSCGCSRHMDRRSIRRGPACLQEKWGPEPDQPEYVAFHGRISVGAVWNLLRLTNGSLINRGNSIASPLRPSGKIGNHCS